MARAARAQLADMRAIEEQMGRQQMHGGQFYGAGATPSMGLSQFRGGASHKCPDCRRKKCLCEESSSDEDMEGGRFYSGLVGAVGDAASAAVRGLRGLRGLRGVRPTPPPTSTALVPYNMGQAAFTTNSAFRNYALNRIFGRPSTALAVRTPGTLKPYSPAEAAARIRAAQAAGETNATVAQKLSRMGVTPARVAAALALGIPAIALAIYFSEVDGTDPDDPGYYDPGAGGPDGPDGPGGPGGPDGPGGPGGPYGPGRGRRATGEGVATGNLADEYYAAQRLGAGKSGGYSAPRHLTEAQKAEAYRQHMERERERQKRRPNPFATLVGRIMREKGISLPAASKFVKENRLY